MIEKLIRLGLTGSQWNAVMFVVRELQGWGFEEVLLKNEHFTRVLGIDKSNTIRLINSLISKKIIEREPTLESGAYIYRFNKENFPRTVAVKVIHIDKEVTESRRQMVVNRDNRGCQSGQPRLSVRTITVVSQDNGSASNSSESFSKVHRKDLQRDHKYPKEEKHGYASGKELDQKSPGMTSEEAREYCKKNYAQKARGATA